MLLASFTKPRGSVASNTPQEEEEPSLCLSANWEPLIKILKRPPNQRNSKSLQSLVVFAKSIKFFKELAQEMSEDTVTQCCLHMTYEYYPQGAFVFHQGSVGSKFYILLQGACTVFVLLPSSPSPTPVSQYQQGDFFGELALLHNKPRAASIECATDVHLAVLEKEDYSRILAKAHEIVLRRKAEFLHALPIFGGWTMGSMQKLIYYFKERTLQRKQTLQKCGDIVDTIYFVREGALELVQDIRLTSPTHKTLPRHPTAKAGIATLGKGECVGAEEAIGVGVYRYTVVCASVTARLLAISREDFLKRVNTEETQLVIKEMTKAKEGLRKRQIEGGKNVRRITTFHSPNFSSEPASLGSSPLLSPKSERAPSITPIPETTELVRLYPPRLKRQETAPMVPAIPKNSAVFNRLKDWEKVLPGKSRTSRHPISAKSGNKEKIVNIHTYKWKQEGKLPTERLCETYSATSRANLLTSPLEDGSCDLPCLKIHSMEVLERSREEPSRYLAQSRLKKQEIHPPIRLC